MALMQVEYYSEVLGLSSTMNVIMPERSAGGRFAPPHPVLYLLHGGSDNHTNWLRNTSIERYVANRGLAVVIPSVQYGFYSNQKVGFDYFTHVAEELPNIVRGFFRVSDRREDTYAAGLSMGGYGAYKLGITHPDRYAAVISLSGSIDQRDRLSDTPSITNGIMLKMARCTFGSIEEYERSENDLAWVLERHLATGTELPRFYQACGTEDHNYEMNAAFHRQFNGRLDLTYEEAEGCGHDWSFWDAYIQRALAWLTHGRG
jgi:putative tributyrin esterase